MAVVLLPPGPRNVQNTWVQAAAEVAELGTPATLVRQMGHLVPWLRRAGPAITGLAQGKVNWIMTTSYRAVTGSAGGPK